MKAADLEGIVPEYHSRNPVIRGLFERRISVAIREAGLDGQVVPGPNTGPASAPDAGLAVGPNVGSGIGPGAGSSVQPGGGRKPGMRVLDVGCGEGKLLERIQAAHPDVRLTGIDTHDETLLLRDRLSASIEVQQESLLEMSFEDGAFDLVFCLDVLEHLPEMGPACQEIRRVLAPQGRLIISAPTESFFYRLGRFLSKGTWSEIEGPGAGPHYWNARALDAAIQANGFNRQRRVLLPAVPGLDLFHINTYGAA